MKSHSLLILITIFFSSFLVQASSIEYRFRINYILENRGNESVTVKDGYVSVIMFPNDEYQTVVIFEKSHNIANQVEDDDNNVFFILDVNKEIAAGSNITFYTEYTIQSENKFIPDLSLNNSGLISDIPEELFEEYCIETETFNWTNIIGDLAVELKGNRTSVYEITTSYVFWINENIRYVNFERPQYPIETHEKMEGDCDDQAILLISMLRSVGVPAYLRVGVIFHESIEGEKTVWGGHMTSSQTGIGWHGWAMVYTPPWGWIPVDLTMVSSKNPEDAMILAPEYYSYIVKAYDISKQSYIRDGIDEMISIMNGDIYVTVEDIAISTPASEGWDVMEILTILIGTLALLSIGYFIYSMALKPKFNREFEY